MLPITLILINDKIVKATSGKLHVLLLPGCDPWLINTFIERDKKNNYVRQRRILLLRGFVKCRRCRTSDTYRTMYKYGLPARLNPVSSSVYST